ncbi:hypothetical protein bcgnr5378_07640 [Bacillus cereus]
MYRVLRIYIPHSLNNTLVTKVCVFFGKQIHIPHSSYTTRVCPKKFSP